MSWSTPADLRGQVQKRWDRGDLLRPFVTGEPMFPLRLPLKGPSSAEIAGRFDAVRAWIAALLAVPRLRVGMREFSHRLHGLNTVPHTVWVDTADDALSMIGRRREALCFQSIAERTRRAQPRLTEWLARRPLRALELAEVWDRLLETVAWMQAHPRPGIYLRQADIPGVHSKFIEDHRGVLSELLDLALPPEAIDAACPGGSRFAGRYGFRGKPVRIRFRILDERPSLLPGLCQPDITLDADSFARLDPPARRVFITENEINFLAFPPVEGGLVIFGAGYGWEALARTPWLARRTLCYWGDIDTHGFAILDQLRGSFGRVESFLMDRETLMAHEPLWGREADQALSDLPRLTERERALFDDLRDNRIGENLRLEQERIGFGWVEAALRNVLGQGG